MDETLKAAAMPDQAMAARTGGWWVSLRHPGDQRHPNCWHQVWLSSCKRSTQGEGAERWPQLQVPKISCREGFQPIITTLLPPYARDVMASYGDVPWHHMGTRSFWDRTSLPRRVFRVRLCCFRTPQRCTHVKVHVQMWARPYTVPLRLWRGVGQALWAPPYAIGSIWDHGAPDARRGICWTYGWKEGESSPGCANKSRAAFAHCWVTGVDDTFLRPVAGTTHAPSEHWDAAASLRWDQKGQSSGNNGRKPLSRPRCQCPLLISWLKSNGKD